MDGNLQSTFLIAYFDIKKFLLYKGEGPRMTWWLDVLGYTNLIQYKFILKKEPSMMKNWGFTRLFII